MIETYRVGDLVMLYRWNCNRCGKTGPWQGYSLRAIRGQNRHIRIKHWPRRSLD